MKRILKETAILICDAHPFSYWVFTLGLYIAIALLITSCIATWHPEILRNPQQAPYIGEQLFELANGVVCVVGVCAPVMDIIIHKDGLQS